MRFLGEALTFLFFLLFLRSVISAVLRMLRAGAASGGATRETQGGAKQPEMPTSGELRKDPTCGMFVMKTTPYTRVTGGTVSYFCSKECRDRYQPGTTEKRWEDTTAARS